MHDHAPRPQVSIQIIGKTGSAQIAHVQLLGLLPSELTQAFAGQGGIKIGDQSAQVVIVAGVVSALPRLYCGHLDLEAFL